MRETWKRHGWRATLCAVLMTATAAVAVNLLLRHLSAFLSFDPTFAAIFAQLADADICPPWLLTLALAFACSLPAVRWGSRSRGRTLMAVVLGLPVWILLTLVTALLTEVNSILFGDVLFSLLEILQKGGLSG